MRETLKQSERSCSSRRVLEKPHSLLKQTFPCPDEGEVKCSDGKFRCREHAVAFRKIGINVDQART